LDPSVRAEYHEKIARLVQPGGLLILEGFSTNNPSLVLQSPTARSNGTQACYTVREIERDFANFEVLELREQELQLSAGTAHKGLANVIRFLGRKR
jgi:hypothetical protein